MNWKSILAARTIFFSGTISRIAQCIFLISACSLAHAANVNFSGQLNDVETDNGGAVYSGVAIGTEFSGSINDEALIGFITDGTTRTLFNCCPGTSVGLEVINDEPLEAEGAAFLNALIGSSFVGGDSIDIIILEVGSMTSGGGVILIEIAMVFDALAFNNNSLDHYPPNPDDILITLFFIEEKDDQEEEIYAATGVVDELIFADVVFQINAGMNDAWVHAGAPFQGFFFTVFPLLKLFFLSWFTFDSVIPGPGVPPAVFGAADQRWVTGLGSYFGDSVTVNVELTSGGIFNGSEPLATQDSGYGTITIKFINCNEALVTYSFPTLGLFGQMTLTRVVTDNVALCQELAVP